MAKRRSANRQTGSSRSSVDRTKKAKSPGKRRSKGGNVYYERRKNRSDKPGTLLGVPIKLVKYPKKPKAGASTKQLEGYLERVKKIDAENATRKQLATSITKRLVAKH